MRVCRGGQCQHESSQCRGGGFRTRGTQSGRGAWHTLVLLRSPLHPSIQMYSAWTASFCGRSRYLCRAAVLEITEEPAWSEHSRQHASTVVEWSQSSGRRERTEGTLTMVAVCSGVLFCGDLGGEAQTKGVRRRERKGRRGY